VSKIELPEDFDPAEPLSAVLDERYERLAQLAVIGVPKQTAAWEAGFRAKGDQPVRPGNVARYFRDPRVRARMVFLAADEAEVIAATRAFVRDLLMNWATLDILGQFAILGEVDVNGQKVTRVIGIDWRALKESDHSAAITTFRFDRETGIMTEFDRVDPDTALAQLRDMYGLRAPRRKEISGPNGGPIEHADVTAYTDDELSQLESILAAGEARTIARGGASGDRTPRD
jgi:hypothetical protein